jgi:hypothetical protein
MKAQLKLLFCLFIGISGYAQESSKEQEDSNIKTYTPSKLLNSGEFEVKLFNGLYSQNEERDSKGELNRLGESQNFLNSTLQITTGLSSDAKFNLGFDINLTSAKYGASYEDSPIDFFGNDHNFSKTVISSIGPRVKFNLFKSIPRLSVQSSFLIPVSKNLETGKFIAHDRYTWFTQFFYDQSIGDKWQVFLELDYLYRIKKEKNGGDRNFFRLPVSGFLSYFPNSKSTIFLFTQYSTRFETVENSTTKKFGLSKWFTQLGLGYKYQLTKKIEFEVSYSEFILSRLDGAGYGLNVGLRYIYR